MPWGLGSLVVGGIVAIGLVFALVDQCPSASPMCIDMRMHTRRLLEIIVHMCAHVVFDNRGPNSRFGHNQDLLGSTRLQCNHLRRGLSHFANGK